MTVRKRFKQLVRARAGITGESYTTALRSFRRETEEPTMSNTTHPESGNEESHAPSSPSLTPRVLTAALQRAGSSATVTTCRAIKQLTENHLYEIDLDGRAAALRIWAVASPAHAHAQVALERRLASCGLPVPDVLLPAAGETLVINGRPAAVLERHEGQPGPNYMPTRVTANYAALAEDMARTVATMHVSALGLEALEYRETTWLENLGTFTRDLDFSEAGDRGREIVAAVDTAASAFTAFCNESMLPMGVVHGSPGTYSVLVDDRRIRTLFDLESAHHDLLVLDVAHIVSQWGLLADGERTNHYDRTLVRRVIDGYCSVRPLSHAEREALALAVPLRSAIDRLRIWGLVGQGRTPFTWEEYLGAFARHSLTVSEEFRSLFTEPSNGAGRSLEGEPC